MKPVIGLTDNDKTVRTQITLTEMLKKAIEEKASGQGKSLSEYLRQAALLQLILEGENEIELEELANKVVGSIDLEKHPEWKTEKKVKRWVKRLRTEWK